MDKMDKKNKSKGGAQFTAIPPFDDVRELFTLCTAHAFQLGISWSSWRPVDPNDVLCMQSYFRPCHQKILLETAQGTRSPCALLRQLLRPHGYAIQLSGTLWTLTELKEDIKTVGKKGGTTVVWNEGSIN